jgi:O-antigen/teichoic acid export membrane protein
MNILTYGYMIITAHAIGKEAFGAFSALMGALLVVNVLSLGLQATGARRISSAPQQTVVIERMLLAVGVRSALLLGAACLLLAPLLNLVLHLDSLPTAMLLGLAVVPLTYMGAQAGVLQGERRWGSLSLVYVAQGLGRVLVGVVLMVIWPTEFWAFAGVVVGSWLPVLVGHVALRRPRAHLPHHSGPPVLEVLREISHSSQALLAFFALSNVDILVARASLSDAEAGYDRSGPTLGQDQDWVLGDLLGLDPDEQAALAADGVFD